MKSSRAWAAFALAAALSVMAGPAAALDALDTVATQAKPGSVRILVVAGASGAPLGFEIDLMKQADHDALGGWPTAVQGSANHCVFTGTPSFNTEGTADDYALAPYESIEVELGQLFDETGVSATSTEELEPATAYVFRVRARGIDGVPASAYSATHPVRTAPVAQNCTYSQGFWRNHPGAWPVTGLMLGTVSYDAAQLLLILEQPAQGNKLLLLAHQLIAAKLNLANGADPTALGSLIADADALIGSRVVPPLGTGTLTNHPATGYANSLDDFNSGLIGPGHCGIVPATRGTWGSIKARYRN